MRVTAHERSLNTDIVLGIAKRIRAMPARADDFHVVVASATIDPRAFVSFFAGEDASVAKPAAGLVSGLASMFGNVARRALGAEEAKTEKPPLQVSVVEKEATQCHLSVSRRCGRRAQGGWRCSTSQGACSLSRSSTAPGMSPCMPSSMR